MQLTKKSIADRDSAEIKNTRKWFIVFSTNLEQRRLVYTKGKRSQHPIPIYLHTYSGVSDPRNRNAKIPRFRGIFETSSEFFR